ncbi:MAG: ABC transporter permease [Burkholderiales bacterium]|nr:ABC transporter permease [Burkholderiales bacterium]
MSAAGPQPLLLLVRFTEREILSRFAGSAFGLIWALANPLLLLAIYAFVFGQLFKTRMGDLSTDSYIVFLAIALWPWMMFADGVMRAMQSVQANAPLVKKVAFPHLLLILAAVNSVFIVHLAGYITILVILAATGTTLHLAGLPSALLAIATLYLLAVGVGAMLAALQTLLRDVEQVVAPALMMLQFLTPVLYPVSIIPESYRHLFAWNPLTGVMQRLRDGFLLGATPQFADLLMLSAGLAVAVIGVGFFMRLSPYFEDFL